jgi:hypothetical protein
MMIAVFELPPEPEELEPDDLVPDEVEAGRASS